MRHLWILTVALACSGCLTSNTIDAFDDGPFPVTPDEANWLFMVHRTDSTLWIQLFYDQEEQPRLLRLDLDGAPESSYRGQRVWEAARDDGFPPDDAEFVISETSETITDPKVFLAEPPPNLPTLFHCHVDEDEVDLVLALRHPDGKVQWAIVPSWDHWALNYVPYVAVVPFTFAADVVLSPFELIWFLSQIPPSFPVH